MRIPNYNYRINNFFVFDGKSSMDFGLGISGNGTYKKPHRRVERFTIPGRNGTLTISDDTFEDVEITYPCYFADGFDMYYQGLMDWLYSKKGMLRLEDTYHPEHFRLAEFIGDVEPDMGTMNFSGRFDLTFRCDGRLFLKSGEREYFYDGNEDPYKTEGKITIINPTPYSSRPLIFTSDLWFDALYVNDMRVVRERTIYMPGELQEGERWVLDCENGEIYSEFQRLSLNEFCGFPDGLPVLHPGENVIRHQWFDTKDFAKSFYLIPKWHTI